MATTNIDVFFEQIEKDFIELSKNAARSAANKAQKDIKKKADEFISDYYEFEPKLYKHRRKHALYKLIDDFYQEKENTKGIVIEFGVKYNPANIKGLHKSNSWYRQGGAKWIPRNDSNFDLNSRYNGIPDARWITEKFWEGIHPSGLRGDEGGERDPQTSDEKMQKFFDTELDDLIDEYTSEAMWASLSKYF